MSSGLVVTGFSIAARQKIWIGIKVYVQDKLIKYFLRVLFVVTLNMINILCIFDAQIRNTNYYAPHRLVARYPRLNY